MIDSDSTNPNSRDESFEHQVKKSQPPVSLPDGSIYTGEWRDGVKEGYGIKEWPNGAKYVG